MDGGLTHFLWGALAMGCWVIGLLFFRYWRRSRDRFFVYFGVAFWFLGLNWAALASLQVTDETRHYVYVLRLIAFLLIAFAIIDKNRQQSLPRP